MYNHVWLYLMSQKELCPCNDWGYKEPLYSIRPKLQIHWVCWDRLVYLLLLAWKTLLSSQMTTRLQTLFLGFCALTCGLTSWTTPKTPRFPTRFNFARQKFRKGMNELFANMPWVCKLLVICPQILEFPASLPVFMWYLLWSSGWRGSHPAACLV